MKIAKEGSVNVYTFSDENELTIISKERETLPELVEERGMFASYLDEKFQGGILGWVSCIFNLYRSYFFLSMKITYYPNLLIEFCLDILIQVLLVVLRLLLIAVLVLLIPYFIICFIYYFAVNVFNHLYDNFMQFFLVRCAIYICTKVFHFFAIIYRRVTG